MSYQLDLFEKDTDEKILRNDIDAIKKELGNVRRGIFARHNELSKMFLELKAEIEKLKESING